MSQYLSRPKSEGQDSSSQDFSRQDVLRILQITSHQLQGWERAGLIAARSAYSFQDLGQLRTLRSLRTGQVSAASIRDSIVAMQAVSGMTNPLQESSVVRTGKQLVFRHLGAMVDPIRRQLVFDFEQADAAQNEAQSGVVRAATPQWPAAQTQSRTQDRFLTAVQAEEAGDKASAMGLYEEIIAENPDYAPAYINLGTMFFHLREYERAEELYRQATEADSEYVLAFFDLGNVLDELERVDESIAAYRRAIELSPRYADAHYNLALAFERIGERRSALRHWQVYVRLDRNGPWAEHARTQIHKLLRGEKLSIAWRADRFVSRGRVKAALRLVPPAPQPDSAAAIATATA